MILKKGSWKVSTLTIPRCAGKLCVVFLRMTTHCRQGQNVTDPPSAFLSSGGDMASLAGTFTRWLISAVLHISWWQLFTEPKRLLPSGGLCFWLIPTEHRFIGIFFPSQLGWILIWNQLAKPPFHKTNKRPERALCDYLAGSHSQLPCSDVGCSPWPCDTKAIHTSRQIFQHLWFSHWLCQASLKFCLNRVQVWITVGSGQP